MSLNTSSYVGVAEKNVGTTDAHRIHTHRYVEGTGNIQVLKSYDSDGLKFARDGKTILIPQPSGDIDDPLNWRLAKKHLVLVSLIFASLLTDFGMTWGVPLFGAQAPTFNMTLPSMAHSISGGIFMQGPGGLLAVPLVQRYGRLPVLFWSQLLAALTVMAAAVSPNYACFTAFRTLQGLVNTGPQVIGLSIIHDMFFFHERTKRINLWCFAFMAGPSIGPFISAWLILVMPWRAVYGVLAALYGLSWLTIIILGDETLYDRHSPQARQRGFFARVKLLVGITGAQTGGRPRVVDVLRHMMNIQFQPHVFLISVVFVTIYWMWIIGIVTTITEVLAPPPYSFDGQAIALSYIGPIIGSILGQVWGHWFNDWLCARYVRSHEGLYVLENRLWGLYPPTFVAFASLVLFGQAWQRSLHWAALIIAWSGTSFGLVAVSTTVEAYCLDSFPNHGSLVAGIINMWRTTGGFCVNYFQLSWEGAVGPAASFGTQAAILGVAFIGSIVVVQVFGGKWREVHLPPKAEN